MKSVSMLIHPFILTDESLYIMFPLSQNEYISALKHQVGRAVVDVTRQIPYGPLRRNHYGLGVTTEICSNVRTAESRSNNQDSLTCKLLWAAILRGMEHLPSKILRRRDNLTVRLLEKRYESRTRIQAEIVEFVTLVHRFQFARTP